jgi:hypothetical protein
MRKRATTIVLGLVAVVVFASPIVVAGPPPLPTPIARWRFDETSGPTAFDDVGSLDGTLAGGAVFVPNGIDGGAIRLDQATQSLVNMGNVLGLATLPASFSISAWFRTLRAGNSDQFIVAKHQAMSLNGYILGANQNAGITSAVGRAWLYVSSPFNAVPTSTTVVANEEWHHVVGVYNPPAGQFSIYVDGGPAEASVASSTHNDNAAPFMIGAINNPGPSGVFTGDIDDVRVFNVALSAAEVQALWRSYSFIFGEGFETGDTSAWTSHTP